MAQGEIRELKVRIPEGMTVTAVSAPSLATWSFAPETRLLEAVLERPVSGQFMLRVVTQVPSEGVPYSASLAALGVLLAVYFLGFNLLEAAMPSLLSRITGSRGRGRRLGIYSTFQFLGAFFGGVAGGWLLGRYGSEVALLLAAVVSLAWGGVIKVSSPSVFPTGEPR